MNKNQPSHTLTRPAILLVITAIAALLMIAPTSQRGSQMLAQEQLHTGDTIASNQSPGLMFDLQPPARAYNAAATSSAQPMLIGPRLPGTSTAQQAAPNPPLAAPTNITTTPIDSGGIIDWDDVQTATGYEIQQFDEHGDWQTLPHQSFTVTYSGSRATIGGLVNGYEYYYRMRAVRDQQYSAWTTTWIEVELHDFPKPELQAATDLAAASTAAGRVTLNWTPAPDATLHWIAAYRGDDLAVWEPASGDDSHAVHDLESGALYFFNIAAGFLQEDGTTNWSPWAGYVSVILE